MKTIIYAGSFQMPDKNAAAHRVLNNARMLRILGYNVVFVGLNPQADDVFLNTAYNYDGFDIFELNCVGAADRIKKFSSLYWMKELFACYNVSAVIAYDYYALGLYRLKKICNKKKIPFIADTDEWFSATGASIVEKIIRITDSEIRMRILQPRLDGVITISKFLYDYYSKKTVTVRIPPLVDIDDTKYNSVREKPNEIPTLVYSGSPSATKESLGYVVECLNKLKNVEYRLIVVGIDKERFLELYNVEPDSQKISFLGRVSHIEALDTVKNSDYAIVIRPRSRVTTAGFPTKFVEAISCGTAVIANNTSDVADYFMNEKNGFLVDEENLEKELEQILQLKNVPETEKDIFDYRKYIDHMRTLLEGVGLEQ